MLTHTHTYTNTKMQMVMHTWHSQDTVSRASKAPGAGLGTRKRTGLSSQQVVWAPEVPPGCNHFTSISDEHLLIPSTAKDFMASKMGR